MANEYPLPRMPIIGTLHPYSVSIGATTDAFKVLGASSVEVRFDFRSRLDINDTLEILDSADVVQGTYTQDQLQAEALVVAGDTIKFRFTINLGSIGNWGYEASLRPFTTTLTERVPDYPPLGVVGQVYAHTLRGVGIATPEFSIESGNLPNGLSLASNGDITGTPTAEQVTEAAIALLPQGFGGLRAVEPLTMYVKPPVIKVDDSQMLNPEGQFEYSGNLYFANPLYDGTSIHGSFYPVIAKSTNNGASWTRLVDWGYTNLPTTTIDVGVWYGMHWDQPTGELTVADQIEIAGVKVVRLWAFDPQTDTFTVHTSPLAFPQGDHLVVAGVNWGDTDAPLNILRIVRTANYIQVLYDRQSTLRSTLDGSYFHLYAATFQIGTGWIRKEVLISDTDPVLPVETPPNITQTLNHDVLAAWSDDTYLQICYLEQWTNTLFQVGVNELGNTRVVYVRRLTLATGVLSTGGTVPETIIPDLYQTLGTGTWIQVQGHQQWGAFVMSRGFPWLNRLYFLLIVSPMQLATWQRLILASIGPLAGAGSDTPTFFYETINELTLPAGDYWDRPLPMYGAGEHVLRDYQTPAIQDYWMIGSTDGYTIRYLRRKKSKPPVQIDSISAAVEAVIITDTDHNLEVGDYALFSSVTVMTEINGMVGKVVNVAAPDTFTVDIDTSGFTTPGNDGNVTLQLGRWEDVFFLSWPGYWESLLKPTYGIEQDDVFHSPIPLYQSGTIAMFFRATGVSYWQQSTGWSRYFCTHAGPEEIAPPAVGAVVNYAF